MICFIFTEVVKDTFLCVMTEFSRQPIQPVGLHQSLPQKAGKITLVCGNSVPSQMRDALREHDFLARICSKCRAVVRIRKK